MKTTRTVDDNPIQSITIKLVNSGQEIGISELTANTYTGGSVTIPDKTPFIKVKYFSNDSEWYDACISTPDIIKYSSCEVRVYYDDEDKFYDLFDKEEKGVDGNDYYFLNVQLYNLKVQCGNTTYEIPGDKWNVSLYKKKCLYWGYRIL